MRSQHVHARDLPMGLERLVQRVETRALELEQLIQEQNTVGGERSEISPEGWASSLLVLDPLCHP
jgi:hypothetical protein